jgi:hypothetical protein
MQKYTRLFSVFIFLIVTPVVSAATTTEPQFSYHSFASCSELESTMRDILPTTYTDGRLYK